MESTENNPLHDYRHIATGSLQNLLGPVVCVATGLITAGILSRELGPAAYGMLGLTVTTVFLVELIITAGFKRSTEKLVATNRVWQPIASGALRFQLMIALIAALLIVLLSPVLADLLKARELEGYLCVYSISLPVGAGVGIFQSVLIGLGRYRAGALLMAAYWLLRLILILAAATIHLTVTAVLLANISASAIILVFSQAVTRVRVSERPGIPLKRFLGIAWPLSLFVGACSFLGSIDLMFVKRFATLPEEVGFYSAAQNLAIVPGLVAGALSPLLLSKLSNLTHNGESEIAATLIRNSQRIVICLMPFAALAAGSASEIMLLIYGSAYPAAGPLLVFLLFGAMADSLRTVSVFTLFAKDNHRSILVIVLPFIPLAPVAYYLWLPGGDAVSAAIISCSISWIIAGFFLIAIFRQDSIYPSLQMVCRCMIAGGLGWAAAGAWPADGLFVLIKLVVLACVVILFLLLSGEFKADERRFLISLLNVKSGKSREIEFKSMP